MTFPRLAFVLGLLLAGGSPARAAEEDKIAKAIEKGAEYLKKSTDALKVIHSADEGPGKAALAGYALLEAGVKPDDPAVQELAKYVRETVLVSSRTYPVALGAIFLERLGDPQDLGLVQVLGVRLYAGQNVAGGWTYTTCETISPEEGKRLSAVIYGNPPNPREKPAWKVHPEAARQLNAVRTAILARGRRGVGDDNSNTQFALIGLWVAARSGLPIDDAFPLIEARFLRTQNRTDGGWSYGNDKSTTAMTCAGLLGLTAGAAKRAGAGKPKPETPKEEVDPFFKPKEPKGGLPPGAPNAGRDAAIKAALQSLGAVLAAKKASDSINDLVGLGNSFYMLWSIERVGVALNLQTIGDVDWYEWGSTRLLATQGENGAWPAESYEAGINTSFALLFLAKANVFRDVAGKVNVKDPGVRELRAGSNPIFVAPKQEQSPPPKTGGEPVATLPTDGGLTLPPISSHPDAEKLVVSLTSATDDQWGTVLATERDTRGAQHTAALVHAIGKLDGDRKKQARDALAERLTRMTTSTLRRMLADPNPELRRAACLACAMKDEKSHILDLIDRITDPSELVVRAARAGLKSLTGKDYGPDPGASDEKKVEAASEWREWSVSQSSK